MIICGQSMNNLMITRLQVCVGVHCSYSQRVIITCHNQACSFTVVVNRSRAKADFGLWYLNDSASKCLHAPHCAPVQQVQMSVKSIAALPEIGNSVSSQKTSARLKCEEFKLQYCIIVPISTMTSALQAVMSTLLETAHTQLQGLCSLSDSAGCFRHSMTKIFKQYCG